MIYDWILEIKDSKTHIGNSFKQYDDLNDLYKILESKTGVEALANIYECFLKTSIRFPETPINTLRKVFVQQNLGKPVATMARKLKVDEATVYSWIREMKGKSKKSKSKSDVLKDLLD